MKKYKSVFKEAQDFIKKGDEIRVGKFKNKKVIVKGFSKDENNQPQVITDKGTYSLYKFRISKLMPKGK